MTLTPKNKGLPGAAIPLSSTVPPTNDKGQVVGRMPSDSVELSSCGSRKRPLKQSFDPADIQHQVSSQKQRPSGNTLPVGLQDHVASLKPSSHQPEASIKAKGGWISAVAKSQSGTTNTSLAMQPQWSVLIKEVKTEIENVAPDSIQAGTGKGLPPRTSGIQWTIVGSSIQEEWRTTSGSRWDKKTKKNVDPSNQPTSSIDFNFLQQVVVAFEELNANQGGTRLAKESISMDPSLEPTFLSIRNKYGNITKDCLLESGDMLTSVLKVICEVVQDLQKKRLTEVDRKLLDSYYLIVQDAEKLKVNVNWLRTRLEEIRDAISCIVETKRLNDERKKLAEQNEIEKKNLESKKAELEKLKSEIDTKESQLKFATLVNEELSSIISNQALRIQQFQNMPLMEAFP